MKYRKKPVIVDAVQITEAWFDNTVYPNPLHLIGVWMSPKDRIAVISTPDGTKIGSIGDWVITSLQGTRYFCKPEIFEKCYEKMGEDLSSKIAEIQAGYSGR